MCPLYSAKNNFTGECMNQGIFITPSLLILKNNRVFYFAFEHSSTWRKSFMSFPISVSSRICSFSLKVFSRRCLCASAGRKDGRFFNIRNSSCFLCNELQISSNKSWSCFDKSPGISNACESGFRIGFGSAWQPHCPLPLSGAHFLCRRCDVPEVSPPSVVCSFLADRVPALGENHWFPLESRNMIFSHHAKTCPRMLPASAFS